MFLLVYIKFLGLHFSSYFRSKISNWSSNFFNFQFGPDFEKIMQFDPFLLNFLNRIKVFSLKLKL